MLVYFLCAIYDGSGLPLQSWVVMTETICSHKAVHASFLALYRKIECRSSFKVLLWETPHCSKRIDASMPRIKNKYFAIRLWKSFESVCFWLWVAHFFPGQLWSLGGRAFLWILALRDFLQWIAFKSTGWKRMPNWLTRRTKCYVSQILN